jgi:hypothetical protein
MLKKEIIDIYKKAPGTSFAVTQRGSYYHKDLIRTIVGISINKVSKVVILNDSPFEVTSQKVTTKKVYDANPFQFPAAQKGAKKTGLLVYDATADEVWIAEPGIFMGEYGAVSGRIAAATQEAERQAAELEAKQLAETAARVGARDKEQQAESQIRALFEGFANKTFDRAEMRISMTTRIEWLNGVPIPRMAGSIEFDYNTLLRIANLIQDLQAK